MLNIEKQVFLLFLAEMSDGNAQQKNKNRKLFSLFSFDLFIIRESGMSKCPPKFPQKKTHVTSAVIRHTRDGSLRRHDWVDDLICGGNHGPINLCQSHRRRLTLEASADRLETADHSANNIGRRIENGSARSCVPVLLAQSGNHKSPGAKWGEKIFARHTFRFERVYFFVFSPFVPIHFFSFLTFAN
jgi:hypothetical protein